MRTRELKRWREVLKRREASRGFLIAFEGPDRPGKTTQLELFTTWLNSEGTPVTTTKWNSSRLIRPLGKVRRPVHVLSPEESCFLHAADFRHRLETEVLPALWQGTTVVADRYLFTTLAGDAARGLPFDWLLNVYAPILWPDLAIHFGVSPDTSGMKVRPITIETRRSIDEQHREIREHYQQLQRVPWPDCNIEPVADWLAHHPEVTFLKAETGRRRKQGGVAT